MLLLWGLRFQCMLLRGHTQTMAPIEGEIYKCNVCDTREVEVFPSLSSNLVEGLMDVSREARFKHKPKE